eukprot:gnl/TRDRNA2_/TRDRNA2_49245_c0_seq1.p1 gnl/TRDRNA2_/TRDRNA2_49245_c0~~gnl/TRDRNA2_/TRDRNA2_49245_c0_seq1.p1  ORF type:complete len:774 (+),score=212.14 gnl/TRDRNA2_/TRDRNA2_49245_c0_seq1:47-2368(+)
MFPEVKKSQLAMLLGASTCMMLVRGNSLGLSSAANAKEQALEGSWGAMLKPSLNESPIKRVESLLMRMKDELDSEAANEAKMYDQMVCWCETNEKVKTKAVNEASARDKMLVADTSSRSARFGVLSTEIEQLTAQIAEDTEALKEASAIREREAAEFQGEEASLVQAVTNLKNAVAVLAKRDSASFLETDRSLVSSLRTVLHHVAVQYESMLASPKTLPSDKHLALLSVATSLDAGIDHYLLSALSSSDGATDAVPLEFAQRIIENVRAKNPAGSFLQQPAKGKEDSHQAKSGRVFGILKQMKEEFEENLSTSQKEFSKTQADYEAMSAAKTEQIETAKAKLDEMKSEHANNQKALSDAKEDLERTRSQRSVDVEFLQNLRFTCQDLDKQWAERSKMRTAETAAISKAIAVITEDDAQELMLTTVTLLQVNEGEEMQVRRNRAVTALRKAAQAPLFAADDLLAAWHDRRSAGPALGASGGPRAQLMTLSVSVELDAFSKVKESMDSMVSQLKDEQAEEVKFKAFCERSFKDNDKFTYERTDVKEDVEARIASLSTDVGTLRDEIAATKKQVAETQVSIKKASETRESENAEFQTTIADQRATQAVLTKALKHLQAFYTKPAAMVQEKSKQTPPVQFASYKKNAGSVPVMALIEQIIEDSKALESDAATAEQAAQAEYEAYVKNSNAVIAELARSVDAKMKAVASAEHALQNAQSDHDSKVAELEDLAEVKADLHHQCDFILKNFDLRQKARLEEMEAIKQTMVKLFPDHKSAA